MHIQNIFFRNATGVVTNKAEIVLFENGMLFKSDVPDVRHPESKESCANIRLLGTLVVLITSSEKQLRMLSGVRPFISKPRKRAIFWRNRHDPFSCSLTKYSFH